VDDDEVLDVGPVDEALSQPGAQVSHDPFGVVERIHAREVFKAAIVTNASAIALAHNHPSHDPSPSDADVKVTRELIQAGKCLRWSLMLE